MFTFITKMIDFQLGLVRSREIENFLPYKDFSALGRPNKTLQRPCWLFYMKSEEKIIFSWYVTKDTVREHNILSSI